jgi:hypothetical protein
MEWKIDFDRWPGPDREKWPGLRDIIHESPDGRHAAVVYSCGEMGVDKQIGRFALLAGPPDSPRILLRPRRLSCFVYYDDTTVQWIGENYCVISPYLLRRPLSGYAYPRISTMFFDLQYRKVSYIPGDASGRTVPHLSEGLNWKNWNWLSLWPVSRFILR